MYLFHKLAVASSGLVVADKIWLSTKQILLVAEFSVFLEIPCFCITCPHMDFAEKWGSCGCSLHGSGSANVVNADGVAGGVVDNHSGHRVVACKGNPHKGSGDEDHVADRLHHACACHVGACERKDLQCGCVAASLRHPLRRRHL